MQVAVSATIKFFNLFKLKGLFLWIMFTVFNVSAQQVNIPRVDLMPDEPAPYVMRDWKTVAQKYDSLVFNVGATGTYLPLSEINGNGINYNGESVSMVTYVGQEPEGIAEAINIIPAVVGASLSGIDKSNQFGKNWVKMMQDFYNSKNGENIYLNNYSGSSGNDWWYETMPNVFFYQLYDLYPETDGFQYQLVNVADRWLESIRYMGASATPWQVPYMNYRAWNFKSMEPLESGVRQPAASGAIAWILYHAYLETGVEDYRIGAEWAMEFLNNWETNPNYELQLAYGVYIASKMNAELGTNYNLDKLLNWAFERGPLRGWGIITGNWGGYDCYGLRGEANDQGDDYAFLMNGFQQASALIPMVRYQEHYANAVAKWVLNLANASRYFYPGFLPGEQQDHPNWANVNDPHKTIAHESMKEHLNGYSPYATGDAVQGGWAPTNLSLYSSSSVGYLGAIVSETNVEKILQLDLNKTDFFSESFPARLLWNPYVNDTVVIIDVGNENVDVYDSRNNEILETGVSGEQEINIPGKDSRMLVYLPVSADVEYVGQKSLANGIVFDYNNGEEVSDTAPRIKALKILQNPVETGDSLFVYCTASGEDLQYEWMFNDEVFGGSDILLMQAPMDTGEYEIKVRVSNTLGESDSALVSLEVLEKIPFVPEIHKIRANPRKVAPGREANLTCYFSEENGDPVTFTWFSETGNLVSEAETAVWTAPVEEGDYYVYCTAEDVDGASIDSLKLMVRDIDGLSMGEPVLYFTFNGHALDASPYNQKSQPENVMYGIDSLGHEQSVAVFNGVSSYVLTENDESLNFTDGLTVAGWFFPQHENNGEEYLVSHGSWENRWKISLNNEALRVTVNTSQGVRDLDSEKQITNEKWYHFAAVYTGEDIEIYINGHLDAFIPWSGSINQTLLDLVVGKARPDQDYYYKGRMDELYVFDHALAPEHIQEVMVRGLTSLPEDNHNDPKLVVYPNPASDFLNISLSGSIRGSVQYKLINLEGLTVKAGWWKKPEERIVKFNIGNLESGVYLLSIKSESFISIRKIYKL